MAAVTDPLAKLANINTNAGVQPIPPLTLPPLPDRLVRIDPDGCAAWLAQANQGFADWVQQVNVLQANLAGLIPP